MLPSAARAQSTAGGFVTASASAVRIDGSLRGGFSAGLGYRFTRAVAIVLEVTDVPTLKPSVPSFAPIPSASVAGVTVPVPTFELSGDGGHAIVFDAALRLEIPASSRLVPYLVGGAGYGSVTERWREQVSYQLPAGIVVPPVTETFSLTTSSFAATFGGGVSFLIAPHLSFDADGRYIGILGARDFHIGRFGGGLTIRF